MRRGEENELTSHGQVIGVVKPSVTDANKNKAVLVERLLQAFNIRILELNENISVVARLLIKQYAQRYALTMGDALIAATAIHTNKALVTANYRDFRFIDGLPVKKFVPDGT